MTRRRLLIPIVLLLLAGGGAIALLGLSTPDRRDDLEREAALVPDDAAKDCGGIRVLPPEIIPDGERLPVSGDHGPEPAAGEPVSGSDATPPDEAQPNEEQGDTVGWPETADASGPSFPDEPAETDDGRLAYSAKITGIVLDARGVPVPGAAVFREMEATVPGRKILMVSLSIDDEHFRVAETDEFGRFEIEASGRFPGDMEVHAELWAKAPGHGASERIHVSMTPEGRDEEITLQLALAARLSGRVVDRNGMGIAGATVWAMPIDSELATLRIFGAGGSGAAGKAVTDAGGLFEIVDIPPGSYWMEADAPGYRLLNTQFGDSPSAEPSDDDWEPAVILPGDFTRLSKDLVLAEVPSLRLRLVDATGAPIANADLELMRPDDIPREKRSIVAIRGALGFHEWSLSRSDPDGFAVFEEPPEGTWELTLRVSGYELVDLGTVNIPAEGWVELGEIVLKALPAAPSPEAGD